MGRKKKLSAQELNAQLDVMLDPDVHAPAIDAAVEVVEAFANRPVGTPEEHTLWLINAIHLAIVEHSDKELRRRQEAESKLKACQELLKKLENVVKG